MLQPLCLQSFICLEFYRGIFDDTCASKNKSLNQKHKGRSHFYIDSVCCLCKDFLATMYVNKNSGNDGWCAFCVSFQLNSTLIWNNDQTAFKPIHRVFLFLCPNNRLPACALPLAAAWAAEEPLVTAETINYLSSCRLPRVEAAQVSLKLAKRSRFLTLPLPETTNFCGI